MGWGSGEGVGFATFPHKTTLRVSKVESGFPGARVGMEGKVSSPFGACSVPVSRSICPNGRRLISFWNCGDRAAIGGIYNHICNSNISSWNSSRNT